MAITYRKLTVEELDIFSDILPRLKRRGIPCRYNCCYF